MNLMLTGTVCIGAFVGMGTLADGASLPVEVITGVTGEGYVKRVQAVHDLGTALSPEVGLRLGAWMELKTDPGCLPPHKLNGLKNEVANVLRCQKEFPRWLPGKLAAMYGDPGYDGVWRDYCIQHLGGCLDRLSGDPQRAVTDILWVATGDQVGGIGGTALIALITHVGSAGIDRHRLATRAYALAADKETGELTRVTALQVCAQLGEKRVLLVARQLMMGSGSIPLRMSAIAAVGMLGDKTDQVLLEGLSRSSDVRLRTAARSGLKRLNVNLKG